MAVASTDVHRRTGKKAGLICDSAEQATHRCSGVRHRGKQPSVELQGLEQLTGPGPGANIDELAHCRRRGPLTSSPESP